LQRTDRLAVVTELAVVVVLEDQAATGSSPVHRRHPALRVQRAAGRELMGRREQGDPLLTGQFLSVGTMFVERERDGPHGRRVQNGPMKRQPVRLHRQRAAQNSATEQQPQRMSHPGAHHDPLRGGSHATGPGQVLGQHPAQFKAAAWIAWAEGVVGGGGHRAAGRGQPGWARERGGIGLPLAQVVRYRRRARGGLGHTRGSDGFGPGRHLRAGALPGDQPALGDQLGVGIGDRVPGQPEIGREGPVGRQPGARNQSAVPDRVTQRPDQRGPSTARAGQLQVQVPAQIGPRIHHGIEP